MYIIKKISRFSLEFSEIERVHFKHTCYICSTQTGLVVVGIFGFWETKMNAPPTFESFILFDGEKKWVLHFECG